MTADARHPVPAYDADSVDTAVRPGSVCHAAGPAMGPWEAAHRWSATSRRAVLARIVHSSAAGPRAPGTAMAVSEDGRVVGSISGGCVDSEVCARAQAVLDSGVPERIRFDPAGDDLFAPALPCGGTLEVLVEPVDRSLYGVLAALLDAVRAGEPVTVATVLTAAGPARHALVRGPDHHVDLPLDEDACARVRAGWATGRTGQFEFPGRDGRETPVFLHSFPAPPRMLVFGADDFAAALTRMGHFLGYHVTLCDARPAFATTTRFPAADEIVVRWPHEYLDATPVTASTVICVLTHDAKFDVPLLAAALRSAAGYVGALGSRRTHADRVRRLRAAGVTGPELARLAAPVGLDLAARTPEETAVSIAAEIIAQLRGGTGARLRDLDLPIHRAADAGGSFSPARV
ncbi:XdhC/CoxI family protein [Nocardia sp. NPDC004568]|uniref:XdhC family protein n=1 Tax=Nocardia sp. NPDC004568 TaxID=3154551 RepID=UPI0033A0F1E8